MYLHLVCTVNSKINSSQLLQNRTYIVYVRSKLCCQLINCELNEYSKHFDEKQSRFCDDVGILTTMRNKKLCLYAKSSLILQLLLKVCTYLKNHFLFLVILFCRHQVYFSYSPLHTEFRKINGIHRKLGNFYQRGKFFKFVSINFKRTRLDSSYMYLPATAHYVRSSSQFNVVDRGY